MAARIRAEKTGVKPKRSEGPARLRPAEAGDAADIARLVLLSAESFLPAVFGPGIEAAIRTLAAGRGTLFGHSHCIIAAASGRTAGMLLGYSGKEKTAEDPATGWGLLRTLGPGLVRRLGRLLVLQRTIGTLGRRSSMSATWRYFPGSGARGREAPFWKTRRKRLSERVPRESCWTWRPTIRPPSASTKGWIYGGGQDRPPARGRA